MFTKCDVTVTSRCNMNQAYSQPWPLMLKMLFTVVQKQRWNKTDTLQISVAKVALSYYKSLTRKAIPKSETCTRKSAAAFDSASSLMRSANCCFSSSKYFCSVQINKHNSYEHFIKGCSKQLVT